MSIEDGLHGWIAVFNLNPSIAAQKRLLTRCHLILHHSFIHGQCSPNSIPATRPEVRYRRSFWGQVIPPPFFALSHVFQVPCTPSQTLPLAGQRCSRRNNAGAP